MSLPGPLAALDLGEPALGFLRTAGQVPFTGDDGEEKLASIWFVVCRTRCWLVAATNDHQWSVGDTDVDLDKGWTWDAVRVGAWSTPLRSGTRGQAAQLLKQWRLSDRGGSSVPAPTADDPGTRAPVAAGAQNVPEWLATDIRSDPEARWLFAFETDREHAFVARNGTLVRAPLWFAVSDRAVVVVAQGPVEPFVREVRPPVELKKRATARDLLIADGWELPGALVDRMTPLAHELANASPGDRWEVAVRQALDASEPDRAVALVREAFVLGRHAPCWSWIGLLAFERDPLAATGAALHALEAQPDADLRAMALAWAHRRATARSATALMPAGLLADCPVPPRPEGLPWPPDGPIEVWACAGILAGRVDDGLAAWASRGDSPRVQQARAATEAAAGADDAWRSWWTTAREWRGRDAEAATAAVERAITLAPDPAELHWRAGAWHLEDGDDPTDHWRVALPALPPADLEQPADAWRRAANLAEAEEAWEAAAACFAKVRALDPEERATLVREAELLEDRLDRLPEAVDVLRELASRTERVVEPDPPRWRVWTEIARTVGLLDAREDRADHPEVLAALKEAVRGDFLVPEAYDEALAISEGMVAEPQRAWWRHVRSALAGGDDGAARTPVRSLKGEALDALHPGGVGWLERARQSLDTSDPPPVADLTRGLERVQPAKWPQMSAAISSLSEALGIEPPATYLFRGDGAWGLSAWPTEPPLVLVGHDHLEDEHPMGMHREALAFALAVELVHLAARHPLLAFDGGLVGTSRSVYQAFGRYAGAAETVMDVVTLLPGVDQIAKIQTIIKLSRRVFTARSVVDKTTGFAETGMSLLGWGSDPEQSVGRRFQGAAIQFRIQADRAALLLTGDLHGAIEAILLGQPGKRLQLEKARSEGLVAVIRQLDEDTAMRLASLLEYAATL
ncbi:MAG: hypothetical protein H6737_19535 [Alphaproteobacteria bacterium]|nr:hypothetical protein [Alphaproteobacteria bacterium]